MTTLQLGECPANADARVQLMQLTNDRDAYARDFERITTMIRVLDASQLLDHDDNRENIRLGSAMFLTIVDAVNEVEKRRTTITNDRVWALAEDRLRIADKTLEADTSEEDAVIDKLADARSEAVDAILALPARTAVQAVRKLELAMFDAQMVRTSADFPSLLAEAKRVVGEA